MERDDRTVALVRDWLAALNESDWERFTRHLAPDVVFRFRAEGLDLHGIERVTESFIGWRRIFAELQGVIVGTVAGGDRATVELEWTGTTVREGRSLRFPSCWVLNVRDGQFLEINDYYDQLAYKRQVGEPLS